MDASQVSGSEKNSCMGRTTDRSVCVSTEKQTQIVCSWIPHREALALDALTILWENMFAYAYPPICLIPKVLKHMEQFRCQLILIAPKWPRRHWYTDLLQMSIACPWKLPLWSNLLQNPNTIPREPKVSISQKKVGGDISCYSCFECFFG